MRNLKRLCSLLLVVAMLGSFMLTPAAALDVVNTSYNTVVNDPSRYTDISGHPYEAALRNALSNGIMYGTTATTATPDATITRAQMATLIVRAFEAKKSANVGAFVDMNADQWFYQYISQAVQMGIISGNGNAMMPQQEITVQEAACVFARAFNLYGYDMSLSGYADSSAVANYARDAVASCIGAGVITPAGGRINPQKALTRAEFTQMMYRLVQFYATSQVPYTGGDIRGSMMVTVPNVTLNNMQVSQNLYLGDGVENGTITLDNVNVSGTVYVRGGTKLLVTNKSTVNTVVVFNPSYAVSMEVDRTSKVKNTIIDTAIGGISLTGDVGDVVMNTAKAELLLKEATVGTLTANVLLPTINIDKDSTVAKMDLGEDATGAKVTHDGKIKDVVVDADDVDITASKNSDIDDLRINGSDGSYKIDGSVDNTVIDKSAEDNNIVFGGDSQSGTIKDNSNGKNDLNVDGEVTMKSYEIDTARTVETLTGYIMEVTVTSKATRSRLTFDKKAEVEELYVEADDVRVTVESGGLIEDVTVSGEDFTLSGSGSVDRVTLRRGASGANISTPETKVINNSGYDAVVGGSTLPSGSTATTDSSGKWDGKLEGDNNNPDVPPPTAKDSILVLQYPASASPSDLDPVGNTTLDMLCSAGYNSVTQSLQGTVNYVENFSPMATSGNSTGFYIPLVLNSNDKQANFSLTVGNKTWHATDYSQGLYYKGKLIFFLPLSQSANPKTISVTYDADGQGTEYNPTTQVISYSDVTFNSMNPSTFGERIGLMTGAMGINGAPGVEIASRSATGDSSANVNMSGRDLIKTPNTNGVEGFWAGVNFVGPSNAVRAQYTVTPVTATGQGAPISYTMDSLSVGTGGFVMFSHYEDIENLPSAIFAINWTDGMGNIIETVETYTVDYSGISLKKDDDTGNPGDGDGDNEPGDGDNEDEKNVVSAINFEAYPEFELTQFGLTIQDFASAYNVQGNDNLHAIAGTYYPVMFNASGTVYDGYYVPLSITLTGINGDTTLSVVQGTDSKVLANILKDNGEEQTVDVFVPLTSLGAQVQNFALVASASGEYLKVSQDVDCSQAAIDVTEVLLTTMVTGTVNGKDVSAFAEMGSRVVPSGASYAVNGTYNEYTAGGIDGFDYATGWFAPIRVTNRSGVDVNWTVNVYYGSEDDVKNLTYTVSAGQTSTGVICPLGFSNEGTSGKYSGVTLVITTGDATPVEYTIEASAAIMSNAPVDMEDINLPESALPGHEPEEPENPGGGDEGPEEPGGGDEETPEAPILSVLKAAIDAIDGITVADVVTGEWGINVDSNAKIITVNGAALKHFTFSNGTDGWAVPIALQWDKAPEKEWTVTVTGDGVYEQSANVDASETSANVWVPVAVRSTDITTKADEKLTTMTVKVAYEGEDGTVEETYTIELDASVVISDFRDTTEEDGGEDIIP